MVAAWSNPYTIQGFVEYLSAISIIRLQVDAASPSSTSTALVDDPAKYTPVSQFLHQIYSYPDSTIVFRFLKPAGSPQFDSHRHFCVHWLQEYVFQSRTSQLLAKSELESLVRELDVRDYFSTCFGPTH
jgi:hypothetical protein